MLLGELMRKFPLPMIPNPAAPPPPSTDQQQQQAPQQPNSNVGRTENAPTTAQSNVNGNNNVNGDFKPPEKRAK